MATAPEPEEWHQVECGCLFGRLGDMFILEPCGNSDCPILTYAVNEATRQGKPIIPVVIEEANVNKRLN